MTNPKFSQSLIPVLVSLILLCLLISCRPAAPLERVTIADASSFLAAPVYVALELGYFRDEGLDVSLQKHTFGGGSLQAVLDGEADFSTSSETPFMHAVLRGGALQAVATTIETTNHLGIAARKDRGISTISDLKGKNIGVTIGSNGEYFLDSFLNRNDIRRQEISTVNLTPTQMNEALVQGQVDAIATWNPNIYLAQKQLDEAGLTFQDDNIYAVAFLISARQDYIETHPETIKHLLTALFKATQYMRAQPEEADRIIGNYAKIEASFLHDLAPTYNFQIALNQSLLLTLENQTRWAIEQKLTDRQDVPNYLDFISITGLEAVNPQAVRIIR